MEAPELLPPIALAQQEKHRQRAAIKRAVNAALDRDHKKRLKVLDEKVAKLSAQIAQEKFEAEEAAVPAYPNQAATWVLSVGAKRSHVDEAISRCTVADDDEAKLRWGL